MRTLLQKQWRSTNNCATNCKLCWGKNAKFGNWPCFSLPRESCALSIHGQPRPKMVRENELSKRHECNKMKPEWRKGHLQAQAFLPCITIVALMSVKSWWQPSRLPIIKNFKNHELYYGATEVVCVSGQKRRLYAQSFYMDVDARGGNWSCKCNNQSWQQRKKNVKDWAAFLERW